MDAAEIERRKAERRARSEAARLQAMEAKFGGGAAVGEHKQQMVVAEALKQVDNKKAPTKRIVFNSDSEGEDVCSSSKKKKKIKKSTGPKLFEDSDDEGADELTINIKNRHEGKKGEKLMALEARFNNDSRFKLNDKFADEDDETNDVEESELVAEKRAALDVLSKVLGKTVKVKTAVADMEKGSKTTAIPARPFTRFDPDNEVHVEWMNKYGGGGAVAAVVAPIPAKKEKAVASFDEDDDEETVNREDEEQEETETEKPAVEKKETKREKKKKAAALAEMAERRVEGHFYEMDSEFAAELKRQLAEEKEQEEKAASAGTGFSFLAMMGRNRPAEEESVIGKLGKEGVGAEQDIKPMDKKLRLFLGHKIESDRESEGESDSEDDEETKKAKLEEEVAAAKARLASCDTVVTLPFFLTGDEPAVKNVVVNFRRTQPLNKVTEKWTTSRDVISKLYHNLRKQAMRNLKEEQKKFGFMKQQRKHIGADGVELEWKKPHFEKTATRKRKADEEDGGEPVLVQAAL